MYAAVDPTPHRFSLRKVSGVWRFRGSSGDRRHVVARNLVDRFGEVGPHDMALQVAIELDDSPIGAVPSKRAQVEPPSVRERAVIVRLVAGQVERDWHRRIHRVINAHRRLRPKDSSEKLSNLLEGSLRLRQAAVHRPRVPHTLPDA
jgi:hypothetical protein